MPVNLLRVTSMLIMFCIHHENMPFITNDKMAAGRLYRVTFVTAHPPILGAVLANKEGYVQIGDKRHVFMVYTKHDKHGSNTK
jgi:hypothetical protein